MILSSHYIHVNAMLKIVLTIHMFILKVCGFLPQNLGRWRGSMNSTLSFYERRLGRRNHTLSVIKFIWTFALGGSGDAKTTRHVVKVSLPSILSWNRWSETQLQPTVMAISILSTNEPLINERYYKHWFIDQRWLIVSELWGCITVFPWLPLVAPSNHKFSGW